MKRYDIRVRYSFEGTYTVAAEDRDEAKKMVNDDCGLVLGGDIHTTRDDDEVLEWDFCIHPDTRILSLQERGGKGSLPSEAVDFSGRIKELRGGHHRRDTAVAPCSLHERNSSSGRGL